VRRSGFARFTNARYSMKKEDIGNTFIHLTNVAIQKHAPGFDRAKGMKWPIRSLRLYMAGKHGEPAWRSRGHRARRHGPRLAAGSLWHALPANRAVHPCQQLLPGQHDADSGSPPTRQVTPAWRAQAPAPPTSCSTASRT
jgi:hypothetical protein